MIYRLLSLIENLPLIYRKHSKYDSGRFWIKGLIRKFEQSANMNFEQKTSEPIEEPLYLNHFIENGNIEEGREAARVKPFCGNVKSYSGFLSVDREKQCHLFFWFFPSEIENPDTPLIVYLNGWATPSTYGIIVQTGPFRLDENGPVLRDVSWHKWYNVLYIDNPLGVGYSHGVESKYSTDLKSVSTNLYWAIHYFYKLFPNLKNNDLYLAGLSMCGNYSTHLAKEIELANSVQKEKFNLKGLFIGNPLINGANQFRLSNYLHQQGIIDHNEKEIFQTLEENIAQMANVGKFDECITSLQGYLFSHNSFLKDSTGLTEIYDVRKPDSKSYEDNFKRYTDFMKQKFVRSQLHVGSVEFSEEVAPLYILRHIIAKSSTNELKSVLLNYRCLFYAGQFDMVINYPTLADVLRNLDWHDKDEFNKAVRIKLYDGGQVYGFSKSYGNLIEVMIRNAGHSAAEDQPCHVIKLLHSFTKFYEVNNSLT